MTEDSKMTIRGDSEIGPSTELPSDSARSATGADSANSTNVGDIRHVVLPLGATFTVLVVILMAVAFLGLSRMDRLHADLNEIAGKRWVTVQLARRALSYSNLNSRITMEIFVLKDRAQIAALLASRAENTKQISELTAEIERRCETKEEKELLQAVKEKRAPYIESYLRALNLLINQERPEAARVVMVNETTPLLLKYHAAWEDLVQFQSEQVDRSTQLSIARYSAIRAFSLSIMVFAVIVATAIAVFTTRNVTRELKTHIREREAATALYTDAATTRDRVAEELQHNNERMRMAVESARIGFWDWDLINDEQTWSNIFKELLGLTPDAPTGFQVLMNSVHPDDREMLGNAIKKAIQEKKDYALEFRAIWPDGSVHWQAARARVLYDRMLRPARMAGIAMDIDRPKLAEERLCLQAEALDAAANSIVITDKNGTIVWTNRAFSLLTGYTAAEACGQNPRLLSSGKHDKAFYANLWETVNAGKTWRGDVINRRKDGSFYTEEMTITPVRSDRGEITHFVAIKQDVTERKHIEDALLQAEAKYRALFRESADAAWLMDENGILDCNSAALELFGYSIADPMRHPADMSPPNQAGGAPSLTAAQQRITAAFLNGKERFEWLHQRKDGTVFPADVCLTALKLSGRPRLLAIVRDITESKRAEEALVQERNLLRTLIDNLPHYIYAKDTSNRFLLANQALASRMGAASPDELLGKSDFDFYQPEVAAKYAQDEQQIMQSGQPVIDREESTIDASNGQIVWHTTTEVPLRGQNGDVVGLLGIGHNITERKRAEESLRDSEETNRVTFEQAPVGIAHIAPDGRYLRANDKLCTIVGYNCEELMKMTFRDITHPDDLPTERIAVRRMLAGEIKASSLEKRYIRKDGSIIWTNRTVSLMRSTTGQPQHFISIVEDITERKRAEERIQFLAYYDALTELPNRTLLQDRLLKALASARRHKEKVALLFLDLDRFKNINDSLGHSIGDLLLQSVAGRIRGWAREQDTVARLGGDEFLVVVNGVKDIADAAVAAERLMKAMTSEFIVQGHSLSVACSLGISIFPDHGTDAEALIKNADAAMYSAKENGRNNFQFFTPNMNAQAVERLMIENDLRHALERKQLFLAYQPQMDIATGRLVGLEALLRWQHPDMGLVSPDKFIRIAENSGLIVPIGEWVLRTACAQVRSWQREGLPAVPVAVNVSAVQFRQEGFCELIRKILNETCLAPHYLELELTESLLISNAEVMLSAFRELNEMGIRLAIDDFGTGYSSLSYLRQFPVSKLKIDRSFIGNVAANPDDAAITGTIISMAKSLNLKVIAEGVETEEQMSFLRSHECDEIQGYYFSKPLPVDALADKLRSFIPPPQHGLPYSNVCADPTLAADGGTCALER